MPTALLPLAVLAAAGPGAGAVAQAQAAFIISGGCALLVDRVHLTMVARQARSAPRAAGLTAAACAALTALVVPLSGGHVAHAATDAALGAGVLALTLLAPALPGVPDGVRAVVWRLLLATAAGVAVATGAHALASAIAVTAASWWLAAALARRAAVRDRAPTAADMAAPLAHLSETAGDPVAERHRLGMRRFGVVSRGGEHRLVDADALPPAGPPLDRRVDWWRRSELVPIVSGTLPFAAVAPALERHGRLLVQVGGAIVGVLDREHLARPPAERIGAR